MQGRLLYADGEAYMYMLSAHQQIEPAARPRITQAKVVSKKSGQEGKAMARARGASPEEAVSK